jgi:hypothetical protein
MEIFRSLQLNFIRSQEDVEFFQEYFCTVSDIPCQATFPREGVLSLTAAAKQPPTAGSPLRQSSLRIIPCSCYSLYPHLRYNKCVYRLTSTMLTTLRIYMLPSSGSDKFESENTKQIW